MKTYTVYGYLTISVVAEVQASNKALARAKAQDLSAPGLCHQCSGAGGDGEWTLNGFDDPPEDAVQEVDEQ